MKAAVLEPFSRRRAAADRILHARKRHLEDWISAKLKLSEINEGFAAMKAGKTVRSVIMFDA